MWILRPKVCFRLGRVGRGEMASREGREGWEWREGEWEGQSCKDGGKRVTLKHGK